LKAATLTSLLASSRPVWKMAAKLSEYLRSN
jgi:hypothetical protein